MARYGMVIDLERCQGCRACMEACKVENNTPESVFWMQVYRLEEGTYPATKLSFLPRPCQHCDDAPCVKVCPVQARYKRDDGLVATDWDKCIGCRYSAVACPYGVNFFNWRDPEEHQYLDHHDKDIVAMTNGVSPSYANPDLDRTMKDGRRTAGGSHLESVMGKCTFCVHRVEEGRQPACVENCPANALHFGDLDDPRSGVAKLLAREPSFRLKEDMNTHPKVHYIGQPPPAPDARQIEAVKGRT